MKIKFNTLAIASALAFASVTASAAINVSTTPDLLFVAYDNVSGATYTRDLGVSLSALTSNQTFNAPAASVFPTQFASVNAANIQWNVYALDNTSPTIYLTGDITKLQGLGSFDVLSSASVLTGELGGLTQLQLAANGYAKPNGEYTGSNTVTDQTNGLTMADNFGFGSHASGKGVGSSQNLLEVDQDGNATQLFTNASLSAFNHNSAGGYFTLLDAGGDLSWTNTNVAAVPLPGAVLLFFPGLLAMFGLGRRNKNRAA